MNNHQRNRLRMLLFYTLCCELGLFAKRLVGPVANVITGVLRIPGGISSAFSIMFPVIAASITPSFGCGTLMTFLQSVLALTMGMTGSLGILAPIGYMVPGLVTDVILWAGRQLKADEKLLVVFTVMMATASAAAISNLLVFRLRGLLLALYLSTAFFSGTMCGVLGFELIRRVRPVVLKGR